MSKGTPRFCDSPKTADTLPNARVMVTETRSAKISPTKTNLMTANTPDPTPQELSIATNLTTWSVMHFSATAKQSRTPEANVLVATPFEEGRWFSLNALDVIG